MKLLRRATTAKATGTRSNGEAPASSRSGYLHRVTAPACPRVDAADDEIAEALRELGGTRACTELLKLCLDKGAPDNVPIIAIVCADLTAIEEVTVRV